MKDGPRSPFLPGRSVHVGRRHCLSGLWDPVSHPSLCAPLWSLPASSESPPPPPPVPSADPAACALCSNFSGPGFQAVGGGPHLHGSLAAPDQALVFVLLLMTLDCRRSQGTAWELWFSLPPVSHSSFFSEGVKVPHPCRPLLCLDFLPQLTVQP